MCLWGEDSDRPVKSPSQAHRQARPHPFAAPSKAMPRLETEGRQDHAVLLLPSVPTAPLDSPEVVRVRPRPSPRRQPMLAAWTVPVTCYPAADAGRVLDELTAATSEALARVDGRAGSSILFLAAVGRFANDLMDHGRILPALAAPRTADETYAARWRPVLQGPDITAVQELVRALPPVARAEKGSANDHTASSPADLVAAALDDFIDAGVRQRLGSASMVDAAKPRRGRKPKRIPAAEAWAEALTTSQGLLELDEEEAEQLARELALWEEVGAGHSGPARATFRLVESVSSDTATDVHGGRWDLEFWLQSIEDPSLLVPSEQVWTGGDGLRRWLDQPDQLMLAELGRASTVYPELAGALRQARPGRLELDAEGAFHFLSAQAPLLEQAGFGVLLPSWWSKRRRLALAARSSTPKDAAVTDAGFGRDQLMQFEWQLAVGEETLSQQEMAALADSKAPLVKFRGEWVAVDPEQLRLGLEFLQREPPRQRSAAEIIRLASSHPEDLDAPLPLATVQADGWLGDLLDGTADRKLVTVPAPEQLAATLRTYQERGLSWLSFLTDLGLGACLADDMGLGKTVQLLALETHARTERPAAGATLLLCPMSLVGNWQREAARFAPSLRVYAHHGTSRLRGGDLDQQVAETDLVVTTYGTAARDIEELLSYDWARVVLDEAQVIKNSLSQTSQAVRRLQGAGRIALTGTPMENRLSELWSIMDFLNPGVLGTAQSFRNRYAVPIERHGNQEATEQLRRVTRPYILRRLKTDKDIIADLPEKIEVKQYCRLTNEQASLYQAVVDEMMVKIQDSEGISRRGNVLAAMTKLKQVCNHPAELLHDKSRIGTRSGKVIRLEEILDEILAEGDKVLCFTQFTEFAEILIPHLSARFDQEIAYLHGGTSKKRRDELVTSFQSEDGPSIFLLSLKAGGTGLNLTAANHVIHLDRWWNPAVEDQATDRAFRIGQNRNVQVRKFICVGTLEEKIDDMIEQKKALADLVISDGEGWLTEMSTGELRDLFALDRGAVDE